jgi:hypothetical protein
LQCKEAECIVGISADWREEHMWTLASFRRPWALLYPLWMLMQSALVALYAWGRSTPVVQADLWLAVVFVWAAAQTVWPAYR